MRYQPLHDRLIITPLEDNRTTRGGILVPDAVVQNKHVAFATVIAVGTGRVTLEGKTAPLIVKEGEIVCFPRKAAASIPIIHDDGSEEIVLLLREADVLAIVHDMPRPSVLLDVTGAPLSMMPTSRAMPDSAAKNREELEIAERSGFVSPEEAADNIDEPNGYTG